MGSLRKDTIRVPEGESDARRNWREKGLGLGGSVQWNWLDANNVRGRSPLPAPFAFGLVQHSSLGAIHLDYKRKRKTLHRLIGKSQNRTSVALAHLRASTVRVESDPHSAAWKPSALKLKLPHN